MRRAMIRAIAREKRRHKLEVGDVHIEHWRIVWDQGALRIFGRMHGHPKFVADEEGFSSAIIRVDGRDVYCESGRKYILGRPAPWSKVKPLLA